MELWARLDIFILTFTILSIILLQIYRSKPDNDFRRQLFRWIIVVSLVGIFLEAVSWGVDGVDSKIGRLLNVLSNTLLYIVVMIPFLLWTIYVDLNVYNSKRRLNFLIKPLGFLAVLNTFFSLLSPLTGWYFKVDEDNLFVRGSLFWILVAIFAILFAYNSLFLIFNKKKLTQNSFYPMFVFMIPPGIGMLLQGLFYGITLAWAGVGLSIFIIYCRMQHHVIETDYLTGLYNRRQLDNYLEDCINNLKRNQNLAAIMIDIDHFKRINDTYGHLMGDYAIESIAKILKRTFYRKGFIARYAGDEFVILLSPKNSEEVQNLISFLKENIEQFNKTQKAPFNISISLGAALYDHEKGLSADQFLHEIDQLMYEDKKNRKMRFLRDK